MSTLTRPLALALLLGTLLLAGGAAMHPILAGSGSMELGMIASMPIWRTMHLCMLGGTGLIAIGIWVRLVGVPANTPTNGAVIAALTIITVGIALDSLNTTFMAGPAWRMASALAGDASIAHQFELLHPVGLMAARFGNYLIALGALLARRDRVDDGGTAALVGGAGVDRGRGRPRRRDFFRRGDAPKCSAPCRCCADGR